MHEDGPTRRPSRRTVLATSGAVGAGLLAGCLGDGSSGADTDSMGDSDDGSGEQSSAAWQSMALEDVRDGETFTIEGLGGPVVIQSFAVWCSNCERQSQNLKDVGDSVTRVGLNTDPNEDAGAVRDHAESKGFDWRFAVAPTEMTEALVDEFGTTVTNAPSTPIIVTCDDGSSSFMSGSIQSASEVEHAADEC